MKFNIHMFAAFAVIVSLASCEELPEYQKEIDAAPNLTYVNPKSGDTYYTCLVHKADTVKGDFSTEFQVYSNTAMHGEEVVSVVEDASLVAAYNQKHGTSYVALPSEYITFENATVTIPANATVSADTVRMTLNRDADLTKLTERYYLAPIALRATGLESSQELGNLWYIVENEQNVIRAIKSVDDIDGLETPETSEWKAEGVNYGNLFDGDNNTSVNIESGGEPLVLDMQKVLNVSGLRIGTGRTYASFQILIEYSEDGTVWKQAGTPLSDEYVKVSGNWYTSFEEDLKARYLRLSLRDTDAVMSLVELGVYIDDSDKPQLYIDPSSASVFNGKIVHKKGVGSTAMLSAEFTVRSTKISTEAMTVGAKMDNALIAAYNEAHATSFVALPEANVSFTTATVDAGVKVSASKVKVSLTGDLSAFNNVNGYLIPVVLTSDKSEICALRNTVYCIVYPETNIIRDIDSADDMNGLPGSGRNGWSSEIADAKYLFDGDNNTAINLNRGSNVITVDLGGSHKVTGFYLYGYKVSNISVAYSTDGKQWILGGTAEKSEIYTTASSWSDGETYLSIVDYVEARYVRLTFDMTGYYDNRISEFNIYETIGNQPVIYTCAGVNNVFETTLKRHTIGGVLNNINVAFGVNATATTGFAVGAEVDNSLVQAFNSANGKSYSAVDASLVKIEGVPCNIPSGSKNSGDNQITVSLDGDISGLTKTSGYVIPIRLTAPDGAIVSDGLGVVYVVVNVETLDGLFKMDFSESDILGTRIDDRSSWKVLQYDEGIYPDGGTYAMLFDGKPETGVRTWGGPVAFTVDMGKDYDITGFSLISKQGAGNYYPNSISIEISSNGEDYTSIGNPSQSAGEIVKSGSASLVAMYSAKTARYLRISASYRSNMGTGEFYIYAK